MLSLNRVAGSSATGMICGLFLLTPHLLISLAPALCCDTFSAAAIGSFAFRVFRAFRGSIPLHFFGSLSVFRTFASKNSLPFAEKYPLTKVVDMCIILASIGAQSGKHTLVRPTESSRGPGDQR
jgi:hypothetical protein